MERGRSKKEKRKKNSRKLLKDAEKLILTINQPKLHEAERRGGKSRKKRSKWKAGTPDVLGQTKEEIISSKLEALLLADPKRTEKLIKDLAKRADWEEFTERISIIVKGLTDREEDLVEYAKDVVPYLIEVIEIADKLVKQPEGCQEAAMVYEKIRELGNSYDAYRKAGEYHTGEQNYLEAAKAFFSAARIKCKKAEEVIDFSLRRVKRVQSTISSGRPTGAKYYFLSKNFISIPHEVDLMLGNAISAFIKNAETHEQEKNYLLAGDAYYAASILSGELIDASSLHRKAGRNYLKAGNYDLAFDSFSFAISLAPELADTISDLALPLFIERAEEHIEKGELILAADVCHMAAMLTEEPSNAMQLHQKAAELLEEKGKYLRAGREYVTAAVLTSEPDKASDLHEKAAELFAKAGNILRSAEAFMAASLLSIDKENTLRLLEKAKDAYMEAGETALAEEAGFSAIKLRAKTKGEIPELIAAIAAKVQVHVDEGKPELAAKEFIKASDFLKEDNPVAASKLLMKAGLYEAMAGRLYAAYQSFSSAIELDLDNDDLPKQAVQILTKIAEKDAMAGDHKLAAYAYNIASLVEENEEKAKTLMNLSLEEERKAA